MKAVWAGWILTVLVVLAMLLDGVTKLARAPQVLEAMDRIGYPEGLTRVLGAVVIFCAVIYAIPRTAVLGAILLTGFLGGATAAKVRLEDPTFVNSVVIGVMAWAGLFLRDPRVRALLPVGRDESA